MRANIFCRHVLVACVALTTTAGAGPAQDGTWTMIEVRAVSKACEELADCIGASRVMMRNVLDLNTAEQDQLGQVIETLSTADSIPDDVAFEGHLPAATAYLHGLPMAEKTDALKNHPGVYFDSSKLDENNDIPGFSDFIRQEMDRIGLKLLTEEEMLATPGRPKMSVRYSGFRESGGCIIPFSVALSITEDVALVRDPSLKLSTAVWSGSVRQNLTSVAYAPDNALRELIEKFVVDYTGANPA
ncbi:MAG: hypothetical protein AAGO57_03250 [Pseudomonadota bacterium]